jgi:hypothetical protein
MLLQWLLLSSTIYASTVASAEEVSCRFTVDDQVLAVYYNGKDLSSTVLSTGLQQFATDKTCTNDPSRSLVPCFSRWESPKTFTFTDTPGAVLAISGKEGGIYSGASSGGVVESGLLLICSDGTISSTEANGLWQAKGFESDADFPYNWFENSFVPDTTWGAPQISDSRFNMTGSDNAQKIWAGLSNYSLFRLNNRVPARSAADVAAENAQSIKDLQSTVTTCFVMVFICSLCGCCFSALNTLLNYCIYVELRSQSYRDRYESVKEVKERVMCLLKPCSCCLPQCVLDLIEMDELANETDEQKILSNTGEILELLSGDQQLVKSKGSNAQEMHAIHNPASGGTPWKPMPTSVENSGVDEI